MPPRCPCGAGTLASACSRRSPIRTIRPWPLSFPALARAADRLRETSGSASPRAFEREFSSGAPSAVAVGSDHPALERRLLEEVFARLALGSDAAIIPAEDGGYCAIGPDGAASPSARSSRNPVVDVLRSLRDARSG